MVYPPEAGLPTNATFAWTTLRVAHMPTASAAAKDYLFFKDQKQKPCYTY